MERVFIKINEAVMLIKFSHRTQREIALKENCLEFFFCKPVGCCRRKFVFHFKFLRRIEEL